MSEYELREMVNLTSINNFIEDEKGEKNENKNNNTYDDDLDFVLCKALLNILSDTSNNNSESNTNIDFNPE
ncbi:33841_t:CDS:2, partial [Racocetra persica]